ncbi:MAG: hypothetical protein ACU0B9_07325 [Limimaricola soesokkakensis]|uniref:hypothetical protein n=1 Tax=Limimaricola soesokkakensis TaxID=1343159 RepID=UPI0040582837
MVTYRTDDPARWGVGKGANLTAPEIDGNFWELAQRLVAVETNPAAPNNISAITVVGSQMTVHMEDGATHGPFTLPTAMIHYRGDWAPGVSYDELDIVAAPNDAGLYLATRAHVSATTFDPLAVDADGSRLYQWLFPMGAGGALTLSELTDVQDAMAPFTNAFLKFNGTEWAPGEAPDLLSLMRDTYIPSDPLEGQVLTWSGGTWRASDAAGGGASSLGDLGDVTIAAPATGEVLRFDGTAWVDGFSQWGEIGGKPATFPPDAHTHAYGDLTGIPATFAPSEHSHDWGTITGKPGTADALPPTIGAAGEVLKVNSNGTGLLWALDETGAGGGGSGASNLDELTDVALNAPAIGQVLKFDGTNWTNQPDEGSSVGISLTDIADVTIATPAVAQFLRYTGTEWQNAVLGWGDIPDKPATFAPETHSHGWAEIGDKPAAFPPESHTHAWGDVSGKPATVAALPAAVGADGQVLKVSGGAVVWSADEASGGVAWPDITDKPATVAALPPALGAEKQVLKVSGGALVWADVLGGGAYTHWRVRILSGNAATILAMQEMQFRTEAGVPETPSGGAVIHLGWTTPERAFDGVVTMSSNAQSNNTIGNWIGYQFPQPRVVRELWIRQFASGYDLAYFAVEASNDGVDWVEVLRVEGATYPSGVLTRALPVLADPANADTLKNVAPSSFALSLLDDADAAAARTTLGAPDIEKGTFTPVVIGDVTPGAATYTYQWGDYTRIGDIVHVSLRVNWSGHTGTGSMRISGLPFVSRGHRNAFSLWPDALNTGNANHYPSALMWRSDSYIQLYGVPLGGPDAEATMMPLPASGNVIISGSYHV